MAQAELSILVKLKDEATRAFEKMSGELKTTTAGMKDAVGASNNFAIGLAALGTAGIAAGAFLVNSARESVAAEKQLEAVLKSTAGAAGITKQAALDLAASLQKVTNFDDEAILGGENLLLTFTKIGKDVFPEATGVMLDMSQALGQDLKSSAIQLGKALNDPIVGVTALQRVGVSFTESQKEQIKTLVESGKTLEAQKFILKELQTEFGGSAKALASPITQMKNAVADAGEEFGKVLLPAVNAAALAVRDFAVNTLPVWIENTKAVINFLREHSAIVYIVAGAIAGVLVPAAISLATTFMTVTIPAFIAAAVALAPFMIAGAAIAGAVAGLMRLWKNSDKVASMFKAAWEAVKGFFIGLWNEITESLTGIWNGIKDTAAKIWQSITDTIMGPVNTIKNAINEMVRLYDEAKARVSQPIQSAVSGTKSFAMSAWNAVTSVVSGKRAAGGPVGAGQTYLVGEKGPELFTAPGNGQIIPNGSFGGGVSITITGNAFYGMDDAVDQMANMIYGKLARQLRI